MNFTWCCYVAKEWEKASRAQHSVHGVGHGRGYACVSERTARFTPLTPNKRDATWLRVVSWVWGGGWVVEGRWQVR